MNLPQRSLNPGGPGGYPVSEVAPEASPADDDFRTNSRLISNAFLDTCTMAELTVSMTRLAASSS
jgi:hypothetical protein